MAIHFNDYSANLLDIYIGSTGSISQLCI